MAERYLAANRIYSAASRAGRASSAPKGWQKKLTNTDSSPQLNAHVAAQRQRALLKGAISTSAPK